MVEYQQLLQLSFELSARKTRGRPREIYLRRAISSAYYGLFHCLVDWATCDLVGQDRKSPRFRLIYRSFQHAEMRAACEYANKPLPKEFGIGTFSPEIRQCATSFIELQKLRHEADYDPHARITLQDTQAAITRAETAMAELRDAPEAHRRLFLVTLRFKPRS